MTFAKAKTRKPAPCSQCATPRHLSSPENSISAYRRILNVVRPPGGHAGGERSARLTSARRRFAKQRPLLTFAECGKQQELEQAIQTEESAARGSFAGEHARLACGARRPAGIFDSRFFGGTPKTTPGPDMLPGTQPYRCVSLMRLP